MECFEYWANAFKLNVPSGSDFVRAVSWLGRAFHNRGQALLLHPVAPRVFFTNSSSCGPRIGLV